MTDTAVRVENLSKLYRIGGPQARYKTLRESLVDAARGPARRLRRLGHPSPENETIWALKDVSFEVKKGDVLGIIGRNGAGKTTLLRILSRITEPTEGYAEIKGRVGSLLEVGTGFHPELTGRENIYLNGAILGMKRAEIDQKFDEIVAFSEIEKFLDTPVKRYSSGMYVRLAFSVAAHLEPEILLVDEVLAVGDAAFQKKCLGKMGDVAHEGRTVLFVSHNMTAIAQLCRSAIWMDNGRLEALTDADRAVQSYLASGSSPSEGIVVFDERESSKEALIKSVELRNKYGEVTCQFDVLSPIKVVVTFRCKRRFSDWRVFVSVMRYDGITIFSTTTWDYNADRYPIDPGVYSASLVIPGRFLGAASYTLTVAFGEPPVKRHDVHENVLRFEVLGKAFDYGRAIGVLVYPFEWQVDAIGDQ
jgi:lipopolysaccharide transport system ATP-binding protein